MSTVGVWTGSISGFVSSTSREDVLLRASVLMTHVRLPLSLQSHKLPFAPATLRSRTMGRLYLTSGLTLISHIWQNGPVKQSHTLHISLSDNVHMPVKGLANSVQCLRVGLSDVSGLSTG